MRFEFHDLAELQTFIEWTGHVHLRHVGAFVATAPASLLAQHAHHAPGLPTPGVVDVTYADGTQATGVLPLPSQSPAEQGAPWTPNAPAPVAEQAAAAAPTKRKRRTQAEIQAEKAAATELTDEAPKQEVKAETTPAEQGAPWPFAQQSLPAGAESTGAPPADSAPAGTCGDDYADFVAARMAERPTMEQIEHMKLARAFIGKCGGTLDTYNKSFELAKLSPNVMSYTPEDCARHAATLEYLSL